MPRLRRRRRNRSGELRRLAPWRARSEVVRHRNPVLRVLGDLDQAALRVMRTRAHGPPLEPVMRGLGLAGEWAAVWVAIGAGAAAVDRPRRRRWMAAAAVGPLAVAANLSVKLTAGRSRPLIEGHPPLARAPTKLSFPSAHATSSVAAATAMARVAPGARAPLYLLAAGICLSRPYLGMHYPSDVAAGAVLGLLLGRLAPGLGALAAEERLIDLVTREGQRRPAPSDASTPERAAAAGAATPGAAAHRP